MPTIKSRPLATALLISTLLVPVTAAAATIGDGNPYSLDIGGRMMWDLDNYEGVLNADGDGDWRFNTQLRRARLEMSGTLPGDFDWVLDVNYIESTNDTELQNAGLRYSGWKVADIFFGRTKEPFGLEELASSNSILTMRRNVFTDATDTDSQPNYGLLLNGFAGPVGWAAGIFNPDGNPTDEDGSDRLAFTGRLFGAPIHDGARVLHLGLAATDRNLDAPESLRGFGLRAAETGDRISSASILADADRQLGLEALYMDGPWSLQAEAFWRNLDGAAGGPDGTVDSQYLQAAWTVTGESRGYKASSGVPDKVKPSSGRGALELVARIERIAFDVDGAAEQRGRILVAGANYYPNRNVKFMFNVSHADTTRLVADGAEDDGVAVTARIQVAF